MPDANEGADMKVLVTGASGLIGSALVPLLEKQGHEVVRLTRKEARRAGEFRWDPEQAILDPRALEGVDAVVHLAGETVAGRWTEDKKRRILESRAQGTRLVSEAIAGLERRPGAMVVRVRHRDLRLPWREPLTEDSAPGESFLAGRRAGLGGRRRARPRGRHPRRAHALRHRAERARWRAEDAAAAVQAGRSADASETAASTSPGCPSTTSSPRSRSQCRGRTSRVR